MGLGRHSSITNGLAHGCLSAKARLRSAAVSPEVRIGHRISGNIVVELFFRDFFVFQIRGFLEQVVQRTIENKAMGTVFVHKTDHIEIVAAGIPILALPRHIIVIVVHGKISFGVAELIVVIFVKRSIFTTKVAGATFAAGNKVEAVSVDQEIIHLVLPGRKSKRYLHFLGIDNIHLCIGRFVSILRR